MNLLRSTHTLFTNFLLRSIVGRGTFGFSRPFRRSAMLTPSRFNILVRVVLVGLLCSIAKPAPAATPKGRMWDTNADQPSAVRWVVSDFEKCLRRSDPSRCQRQLSDDAILVFDGATQANVNNLAIQEKHNPTFSHAKAKLAYRQFLINDNTAQVIVDDAIAG